MKHNATPRITTTVQISPEFYHLCRAHHITFADALRTGVGFLLAEKGVQEYDSTTNLFRKMSKVRETLEETSAKLADMEAKVGRKE